MPKKLTLYEDEMNVLLGLPNEQRGRILTALICAATGNEIPEMDCTEKAIFTLVNGQIKRAEKLSNTRKQSANARWQNQASKENCDTSEETNEANDVQNGTSDMQIYVSDIQKNANSMQTDTSSMQDVCTNTSTITSTNTITDTSTETIMEEPPPSSTKPKPDKPKKPEKKHYAEFVTLTDGEHNKLLENLGEDGLRWCIEKLDNYKGSSGRRYASDYRTILGWVKDSWEEEQAKHRNQPRLQQGAVPSSNQWDIVTENSVQDFLNELKQ